jgi:hypothetical protein
LEEYEEGRSYKERLVMGQERYSPAGDEDIAKSGSSRVYLFSQFIVVQKEYAARGISAIFKTRGLLPELAED